MATDFFFFLSVYTIKHRWLSDRDVAKSERGQPNAFVAVAAAESHGFRCERFLLVVVHRAAFTRAHFLRIGRRFARATHVLHMHS